MINVAIVDDNYREIEPIIEILKVNAENFSYKYFEGSILEEIYEWTKTQLNPVVLLDLIFDGEELGEALFGEIKKVNEAVPIFIFTSSADLRTEEKYKNLGCYDYIVKNRVNKEDAQILLDRIKRACEAGSHFNEAFEKNRKLWSSNPKKAIFELEALLNSEGSQNLMALYELQGWIKAYMKKGLDELSIGIPRILSSLERNCLKIEALQKDVQVDIMLDKAMSQTHLGKTTEAALTLKKISTFINQGSQQKRFIESLAALSSLIFADSLNARKLLGIVGIDPCSEEYGSLLECLNHYDKTLWNEAVSDYFEYWQNSETIESTKIMSLFDDAYYSQITESEILKDRSSDTMKFIFDIFAAEIQRAQEKDINCSNLHNCCKYLFETSSLNADIPSDKDTICATLNSFASLLYIKNDPMEWIDFADMQIARIGTSEDHVIRDMMNRPGRANNRTVELLYQVIHSLLRRGMIDDALRLLQKYDSVIINADYEYGPGEAKISATRSYQLYRFGELFKESGNLNAAAHYLERAVQGFSADTLRPISQKRKGEILLHMQITLKNLKDIGADVKSYEANYMKLSSENVRVPLPFDNKRCALAGGHDAIGQNILKFEESLGGRFRYFGLDSSELVNSIKTGGIDIIIYIAGFASHSKTWNKLKPAVDQYKDTVRFYMIPEHIKNVDGIIAEIKRNINKL